MEPWIDHVNALLVTFVARTKVTRRLRRRNRSACQERYPRISAKNLNLTPQTLYRAPPLRNRPRQRRTARTVAPSKAHIAHPRGRCPRSRIFPGKAVRPIAVAVRPPVDGDRADDILCSKPRRPQHAVKLRAD